MAGEAITALTWVGLDACMNLGVTLKIVLSDETFLAVGALVLAIVQVSLDVGFYVFFASKLFAAVFKQARPFAIRRLGALNELGNLLNCHASLRLSFFNVDAGNACGTGHACHRLGASVEASAVCIFGLAKSLKWLEVCPDLVEFAAKCIEIMSVWSGVLRQILFAEEVMLLRLVREPSLHFDEFVTERVHVHEVLRHIAERFRMGHWRGAGRARSGSARLGLLPHILEHVLHVLLAAITIRLDSFLHRAIIVVRESVRSFILLCKPIMWCFHWGRGVVSL